MKDLLKVLMVEDSVADADLIQFELKQAISELEVKVVANEKNFTSSLLNFKPHVILSDFSMPGFDGLSALSIAQKLSPEIPFIFVSGTIGEERAIEALKSGATDYILKDHISGLIPKLNRALKEAKERVDKIKAEAELLKKQEQLLEAQELARMGNWEFNLKSRKITWSREIYKIFGIKPYSVTPTISLYLSLVHPDDLDRIKEGLSRLKKTQLTENPNSVEEVIPKAKKICINDQDNFEMINDTFRIVKNDTKEICHIFAKVKFYQSENNNEIVANGIIQDVTELKETEKRLEESNKDLKTFIYKSSHDLRGPISSSLGLIEYVKMEIEESSKIKDHLSSIQNCLLKLDQSICSLTKVMSLKEKRREIQPINFSQIYTEIKLLLKFSNGFSKIQFTAKGLKIIFNSDPEIVFSIIQNLIENSIKYQNTSNGEPFIKLVIRKKDKGVKIELSDNGIGIDEEIKPKIFDMFYRGSSLSKGSGLGLYIVKSAVEKLNGTIKVDSIKRVGTKFTIFLPDSEEVNSNSAS